MVGLQRLRVKAKVKAGPQKDIITAGYHSKVTVRIGVKSPGPSFKRHT